MMLTNIILSTLIATNSIINLNFQNKPMFDNVVNPLPKINSSFKEEDFIDSSWIYVIFNSKIIYDDIYINTKPKADRGVRIIHTTDGDILEIPKEKNPVANFFIQNNNYDFMYVLSLSVNISTALIYSFIFDEKTTGILCYCTQTVLSLAEYYVLVNSTDYLKYNSHMPKNWHIETPLYIQTF